MNSLQIELNTINEKLELLTYRKSQLDAIIGEYSDVVNRVKNLIETMQDANVEPSNLLMEIEQLIYCPDLELEPAPEEVEATSEILQAESSEAIQEEASSHYKLPYNDINNNEETCNGCSPDSVSFPAITDVKNPSTSEAELTPIESYLNELPSGTSEAIPEADDDSCDTDGLDDEDYGFDDDDDDDEIEETPKPEQRGNSLLYEPNTYWDNGSSVRVILPKKSHNRKELEAIVDDCIEQKLVEQFEINECGKNWIIGLSPVTDELVVNDIIDIFHPAIDETPEPTPETVRLMAMVPVTTPAPAPEIIDDGVEQEEYLSYIKKHQPTPTPAPKTQLNERAWQREDTLLIGFSNKRLLNTWAKWFKDTWSDRVKVDDLEKLEGFDHCLSILWFGQADWERLSKLDYSLKPTEQNKQKQQPEAPPKVSLEDVKATLKQLHDDGVTAILKDELLDNYFDSLTVEELEQYLEKLAEQGLIALGDYSIGLKFPESPVFPAFEYEQVDEKTTKIYADGVLLGLAKDCGSHWESPQFKGEKFPNRRDVVNALWQLINNF